MKTKKSLLDIAFGAHMTIAIAFLLGGFLDIYIYIVDFGYSGWLSFVAAMLSLFIFLPTIVIIVPALIVVSLLQHDGCLLFLTSLLVFTLVAFYSWPDDSIQFAPYTLASVWFSFEWFSKRRKNIHS